MNKKIKKLRYSALILIILVIIFISFNLSDENKNNTLENDYYKIVPDKKTGMFNIYIKKLNTYVFFNSSPLSSKILIKYDNFQYTLESIGNVINDFTLQDNKLVYTWGTRFIELRETISFIELDKYNIGVQVSLEIKNLDVKGHFVGIGVLFDTYLGESYNKPFQISNIGIIENEQYFSKSSIPNTILSLDNPNNPVTGVIFYPRRAGITTPDKIIIANYDLLLHEFWGFSFTKGRSFNSTYKRTDAAIGFVFDETFTNTNQSRSISYILGIYPIKKSEGEVTAANIDKQTDKIDPVSVDSKNAELKAYIEQQIAALNQKLKELQDRYNNLDQMDKDLLKGMALLNQLINLLAEIDKLEQQIYMLSDEDFIKAYDNLVLMVEQLIDQVNQYLN